MKIAIKFISILSILFGVEAVQAGCNGLSLNVQPALFPLDTNNDGAVEVTVSRNNNSNNIDDQCFYLILIENAGGATSNDRYLKKGGSTPIRVQFYKTPGHGSNVVKSSADAVSLSDGITGVLGVGVSSQVITYNAYVDPSWIGAASTGPHTERFSFKLYRYDGSTFGSRVSVNTNADKQFQYTVSDTLSLSLVRSGSPYNAADVNQTLDFGTLTDNKQATGVDLWLVYKNGYKLTLTSANAWNLKNQNAGITSSNLIPYTLSLGGVSVQRLSGENMVLNAPSGSASAVGGDRYAVAASVQTVGTVYNGSYGDTVTFKILAP